MSYISFIRGLEIARMRGNIEEEDLVKNILHATSHEEVRKKLNSFQINFSGSPRNFFE